MSQKKSQKKKELKKKSVNNKTINSKKNEVVVNSKREEKTAKQVLISENSKSKKEVISSKSYKKQPTASQAGNIKANKKELKELEQKITRDGEKSETPNKIISKIKTNWKTLIPLLIGLIVIALFATFNLYVIPEVILTQTDDYKFQQEQKQAEKDRVKNADKLKNQLAIEDQVLKFSQNKNWKLQMEIQDFGTLEIESKMEFAPETVENFIRLVNRSFYNDKTFEKMIKQENFNIIQAGSESGKTQGKSAYYIDDEKPGYIKDELWKVAPQYESKEGKNVLTNKAKLNYPNLYGDFDEDTGTLLYPKGLFVSYSEIGPNTNNSQFFITLTDTKAPAEFAAFAKVSKSSFKVLDKILKEVETSENEEGFNNIPNKEIKINSIKIIEPEL